MYYVNLFQWRLEMSCSSFRIAILLVLVALLPTEGQYWKVRPTPQVLSTTNDTYGCDYYAQFCLRAYNTSSLCGRTMFWMYHDFKNYCMLDYVNCMERYELWQVAYMGHCFYVIPKEKYTYQSYRVYDDAFLDRFYMSDEWNLEHMWSGKKPKQKRVPDMIPKS